MNTWDMFGKGQVKVKKQQSRVVESRDEVDYDDDYQDMVRRVRDKAKAADALKAQGKEPQTKFNPKSGKYYVDHGQDREVKENAEELNVGDPVIITGDVEFNGKTGDIAEFGRDKRFVVVNLYNHGKHSFHSSDVEYNDHADLDEANPQQQLSIYNPSGATYRTNAMPTLDADPVDHADRIDDLDLGSYEQDFSKDDLKRIIAKHLDVLDDRQKEILKLRYWQGMTLDEVGKTLNISKQYVRHLEARALSKLKQKMPADLQDMDEAGYGSNRGYTPGFASPHAPALGGRRHRDDDEGWGQEQQALTTTWYIRVNGKIIKDKMGVPYQYRGKEAAAKAAQTMMAKSFNAGKKFVLTTKAQDDQPENEATLPTEYKHNRFTGIQQRDQARDQASKSAMNRVRDEVDEGMSGQVVFSGTGTNSVKYEIIQSGDGFMIHANGNHIDTYGSLQRAMSVLKNEVPGLQRSMAEATGDKPFDKMMTTIKQGTNKQKTADRKEQQKQTQQRARDAFGNMFGGGNPADKLSIRKGVAEEQELDEKWSQKYKSSINCSHPKGFSQRAHCAGKKKHNESIETEMVCEDCGMCETHGNLTLSEIKQRLDPKCWKGKHKEGTKIKGGIRVNNCVPNESLEESNEGRCMQCGMKNCKCPGNSCKCKPIKGWEPGKGFKKAMDEDMSRRGFLKGMGAMAAGAALGGAAHAQSIERGEDFLPDIVANVKFKVNGQTISKKINLGTQYTSPGEASAALEKFLKSKGIRYYEYSLERVKPGDDQEDYLDKTPATNANGSGSIDNRPYQAVGSKDSDYMAKESIDEAIDNYLLDLADAGYDIVFEGTQP